ncbi:MAG: cobalt ECF transporter T component CbiQ [Deltaproteobacteria bacterium]|jgi:cobalt/nickel transport system permease protein|nr:cobalt ECF transporter T component CbiQ [Deltaproteobacteria bacterium]
MFDEPFARGQSFIHKLDPRIRLLCAGSGIICTALLRHRAAAVYSLLLAVILFILSKPKLKFAFKRILAVNIFILFLWLTVPLSPGGENFVQAGSLGINRRGVELVTLLTLKSNAIALLFLALVATMNVAVLGKALSSLRCPDKLVFLLLFTYRYIHVVLDGWQRLWSAAKLRAFTPGSNVRSYRAFANMLGMTFVQSFTRSGRVYEAMRLRGFSGSFVSAAPFKTAGRDIVFVILLVILLAIIYARDIYGVEHAGSAYF